MNQKEMIAKLADTSFTRHPAWPSFVEEMKGKEYGQEPLMQAWAFYKLGWDTSVKTGGV